MRTSWNDSYPALSAPTSWTSSRTPTGRNSSLLSALFDRKRDQQRRSLTAGACHFDRPPERVNAVGEAYEPGTTAGIGPSAAIVADREPEDSVARFDQDLYRRSVRMLRGIRKLLRDDVISGDFHRLRQLRLGAHLNQDGNG